MKRADLREYGITMLRRTHNSRCLILAATWVCLAIGVIAHAQVEVDKPLHLAKVEGYVVNSQGKPVAHEMLWWGA